jgi:hypothetical protein
MATTRVKFQFQFRVHMHWWDAIHTKGQQAQKGMSQVGEGHHGSNCLLDWALAMDFAGILKPTCVKVIALWIVNSPFKCHCHGIGTQSGFDNKCINQPPYSHMLVPPQFTYKLDVYTKGIQMPTPTNLPSKMVCKKLLPKTNPKSNPRTLWRWFAFWQAT